MPCHSTGEGGGKPSPYRLHSRPTRVNRNRKLAVVATTRKSEASARTAPAPAAMPLIAAMIEFRAFAHVLNYSSRHAGEVEQPSRIKVLKLADNRIDVSTGTEATSASSQHYRSHVLSLRHFPEEIAKVSIHIERKGVELVRSGEGDDGDPIVDCDFKIVPDRRRV